MYGCLVIVKKLLKYIERHTRMEQENEEEIKLDYFSSHFNNIYGCRDLLRKKIS